MDSAISKEVPSRSEDQKLAAFLHHVAGNRRTTVLPSHAAARNKETLQASVKRVSKARHKSRNSKNGDGGTGKDDVGGKFENKLKKWILWSAT